MNPGIYNISFDQYQAIDAVSKSGLDALAISPLHYWTFNLNPERIKPKDTAAKVLGSAIHTSILEPERYEKEYVLDPQPEDFPGSLVLAPDYKEECAKLGLPVSGTKPELMKRLIEAGVDKSRFWDEAYKELTSGKISLSKSDWYTVKAISYRVRKHPYAGQLLKHGVSEQSIIWIDEETGVLCKGRLDWVVENQPIIVDLKSTTDASLEGFQRSISKYRYYVQAAMYLDGVKALGYGDYDFIFAAWEKKSPFASALYYPSKDMLEVGRIEYKKLLNLYKKCRTLDEWKGYNEDILEINLPENFKSSSLSEQDSDWDWLGE
jgi:hypothetical protein